MVRAAALGAALLIALGACGYRVATTGAPSEGYFEGTSAQRANASLRDAKNAVVGLATFTETRFGVLVALNVRDMTPGQHGIHVHAVNKCDPPEFTTAGAHFNPNATQHGAHNPKGPHAGDLPNLVVGKDGTGTLSYVNPYLSMQPGAANSILASSLVVHKDPDDEMTDPSGNSGGRIACGLIAKVGG